MTPGQPPKVGTSSMMKGKHAAPKWPGYSKTIHYEITGAGAALATINRIPVLLLPSDFFATRAASPLPQELEDPRSADVSVNDAFKPVSRFWDRINRPE